MSARVQKKPKLTETLLVAEWAKDRDGKEVFTIKLEPFEGTDLLAIRIWYRDQQGELRPGRKGVAISARHLRDFFNAMKIAEALSHKHGLMGAGDGA